MLLEVLLGKLTATFDTCLRFTFDLRTSLVKETKVPVFVEIVLVQVLKRPLAFIAPALVLVDLSFDHHYLFIGVLHLTYHFLVHELVGINFIISS